MTLDGYNTRSARIRRLEGVHHSPHQEMHGTDNLTQGHESTIESVRHIQDKTALYNDDSDSSTEADGVFGLTKTEQRRLRDANLDPREKRRIQNRMYQRRSREKRRLKASALEGAPAPKKVKNRESSSLLGALLGSSVTNRAQSASPSGDSFPETQPEASLPVSTASSATSFTATATNLSLQLPATTESFFPHPQHQVPPNFKYDPVPGFSLPLPPPSMSYTSTGIPGPHPTNSLNPAFFPQSATIPNFCNNSTGYFQQPPTMNFSSQRSAPQAVPFWPLKPIPKSTSRNIDTGVAPPNTSNHISGQSEQSSVPPSTNFNQYMLLSSMCQTSSSSSSSSDVDFLAQALHQPNRDYPHPPQ